MKKNERPNSGASASVASFQTIDRDIRSMNLETAGETDETLAGRLQRVVTVFSAIRPLLLTLTVLPGVGKTSRAAVTMFVQALDALSLLAVPGGPDDVADFKAGRDL
jgi:hypothetical protein